MLLPIAGVVLGFIFLYFGSDWLVKGASNLSISLGVRPFIVGITVVAFGSSAPEAVLAVTAVTGEASQVALGNVVGSNVANLSLVIGVAALVCPLVMKLEKLQAEMLFMFFAMVMATIMALDGQYSRIDGLLLLVLVIAFVGFLYWTFVKERAPVEVQKEFEEEMPESRGRMLDSLQLALGLVILIVGAQAIVYGAVEIATELNVTELVIGLTLVAIGTSLPELSISVAAACNNEPDILISNVVGSNIFNSLLVIGAGSTIFPISVPDGMLVVEYPMMLLLGGVFLLTLRVRGSIYRSSGILLLSLYALYLLLLMV